MLDIPYITQKGIVAATVDKFQNTKIKSLYKSQ